MKKLGKKIFAGIDIGSRAAKAAIISGDDILSSVITDTGPDSINTAYRAITEVLQGTRLSREDIDYIVATGYGRVLVPFANENISEITCHARGINWYFPSVRTILDMGGQDCKAISCTVDGKVTDFVMNDKCAGGTGRFLEMIADVLNIPLEEIGKVALRSEEAFSFNTICAIFAKTEAIAHLRRGVDKSDILAGLHEAIAARCVNLLKRVSIQKEFTITGGIAKNIGMVAKLKEKVGLEPLLCEDPQIIGALGAAILARERYKRTSMLEELKIHYGYSDGSGDYFITIDMGLCNGCGECLSACPADIFEMTKDDNGQMKAVVRESVRTKLAFLCPGLAFCSKANKVNCHSCCHPLAISHTW